YLPEVPIAAWADHGFVSLQPVAPFDAFFAEVAARVAWMPVGQFTHDPGRDRDHTVHAHWALYVKNYLEGFHIPFVHGALDDVVDYGSYRSELNRYSSLQIARAKPGELAFDVPESSRDAGLHVAAYYGWVFP